MANSYSNTSSEVTNLTMSNCREAIRSCLSMNPVCYNTSSEVTETNTTTLKSLESFPKFELQGSEIVVRVTDPDSYTLLGSGIMYADIDIGTINDQILSYKYQKVSLNYNLYTQNGLILKSPHFDGTPTKLSTVLGAKGFAKALKGMKPKGKRRIILPPKVTSFGEYRVVDVRLHVIEKPGKPGSLG